MVWSGLRRDMSGTIADRSGLQRDMSGAMADMSGLPYMPHPNNCLLPFPTSKSRRKLSRFQRLSSNEYYPRLDLL